MLNQLSIFMLLVWSNMPLITKGLRRFTSIGKLSSISKSKWTDNRAPVRISMQAETSSSTSSSIEWPVDRVRSTFIKYFETKQEHKHIISSPVVPVNDPTLLFANAGMNQFKPIFIGNVEPTSPLYGLKRVVNSQKCIRAGGKHNDLDDVGKDVYHHTFFEMLGTWSFGNYFKKEAITWAYDILVNTYKLPVERLYASYFGGDESLGLPCDTEARDLWLQYLPAERVLPFDKKANFWEMGETGPCGPCSEIHFDRIGNRDAAALVNNDDPDVLEIWNLVFIQYNRETNGDLKLLPAKHIDTGMGLERLTSVMQDKRSNYDTDIFTPLFDAIQKVVGCEPYTGKLGKEDAAQGYKDMAYRVIADHIRTLTFAITDGAVPSNEGRGYVLRRVLRRAVRYGMQTLGAKPGFFSTLVPTVAQNLGGHYPEIHTKIAYIQSVLQEEEQSFASLLERGIKYFNEQVQLIESSSTKGEKIVTGDMAFFMYDTLGFPLDLTQIMATEKGLSVDVTGFQAAMLAQKERGRQAGREKRLAGRADITLGTEQISVLQKHKKIPITDDSSKYEWNIVKPATIQVIVNDKGAIVESAASSSTPFDCDTIGIVLSESPFYPESGGQVADSGTLIVTKTDGSQLVTLEVVDVQTYAGYTLHTCVAAGDDVSLVGITGLTEGLHVQAEVDYVKRRRIAPNHSMTHVLNFALRKVLTTDNTSDKISEEINQKGSQVTEEKLRFDFSFSRGVTVEELALIESLVNTAIKAELSVHSEVVPLKQAMEIAGLRAVFGEKYPDPVRVVSVGQTVNALLAAPTSTEWLERSIEFCGGTHVSNTKEAQFFVITEETAVAKGIRRISAITGADAVAAQTLGQSIKHQVDTIATSLAHIDSSSSPASTSLDSIDLELSSIRLQLDTSVISQSLKSGIRTEVEKIQKQVLQLLNKRLMQQVDTTIQQVKQEMLQRVAAGESSVVLKMDIGSDAKAIKRAIEELKKTAPTVSFMGISIEKQADNTGSKVTVFALVTDQGLTQLGLKANDWVNAVVSEFGGRGGGKPALAQGSAFVATTQEENLSSNISEKMVTIGNQYIQTTSSTAGVKK